MGGRGLAAIVGSAGDGGGDKEKSSWPEMVGKHMVEAMFLIKVERQDVSFKILGAGDPQPPDFDAHRVCIFHDDSLIVVRTPVIG